MLTTLYGKLAAVLLGLLCLIGSLYICLTLMTTRLYYQEVTQKLNRALAQNLVAENMPLRGGHIDRQALQDIFHLLMVINPSIEVYLLDPQGAILAYSAPPGRVPRQQVALDPVHRFLRGSSAWPILGGDPRSLTRRKVFSVAPIPPQGVLEGYLYIVLTGEEYDSVTQMLQGSYMLRLSLWAAGAGLVFAVATGLLLFYLLTRRLMTLAATMDAFQQSTVAERGYGPQPCATQPVEAQRGDDIDRLGATFQAMTQRIHQQVQTLQHTDRRRRELVAHVSHDLRTPLAALHGSLETLCLKDTQLTPQERRHYLDIAMRHSTRLGTLVAELFELAKLDAHETQVHAEAFSLAELVQDVVQKFQLLAHQKQQRLHAQLTDDLPFVWADIALIERVLDNLLQNALRYTAPGGTITVALTLQGPDLAVQVTDTGSGIPPEDLPYIFDPFYRAGQGRQDAAGGVGLGLAIAKRILELHGSAIAVDSAVPGGTTFTFSLPMAHP